MAKQPSTRQPSGRRRRSSAGRVWIDPNPVPAWKKEGVTVTVVSLGDQNQGQKTHQGHMPPAPTMVPECTPAKPAGGRRPKVLELAVNLKGEFYVLESIRVGKSNQIVTWHFDVVGERWLREHQVEVGQRIPTRLFRDLKEQGRLVTEGKTSAAR